MVDSEELLQATAGHMIFYENPDGRVCVLFPFKGKVLVGSTDLPVDRPDDVKCTPEERAYILESLAYIFPEIDIRPEQILYTFSGVRPLPRSDAQVTGEISRNHQCRETPADGDHAFHIYSMIGGKWTTFRAFGEQVADRVLSRLGQSRRMSTVHLAIGGGAGYPTNDDGLSQMYIEISQSTRLSVERVTTLVERYGTRARLMADFLVAGSDEALRFLPDYSQREMRFLIEQERVVRLADLVMRRTPLAISGHLNAARLAEVNQLLGEILGWSQQRCEQELTRTIDDLVACHDLSREQLVRTDEPHTQIA